MDLNDFNVAEPNPKEQGLKPSSLPVYCKVCVKVAEPNPKEQGLKLGSDGISQGFADGLQNQIQKNKD